MEKLLIKLTTIIFVSAILVNPVTSSTTQSNTISTEQSTAQTSVQSTTTTTQSITTTPQSITTTLQSTTTTTQSTTTTQPTIPVNISGNCNDSSQCKAVDEHTECNNDICECNKGYFKLNATYCAEVNYLNPSSLRLNSTETNITAAWTGPSYLPPQYHIVYHVEINGDENYNTTTGANETEFGGLTAGKIYTVFVISVVNETILSDKINGTQWTRPYPPDCPPNKYNYTAPNITVSWEKPSGEVDGYNITFNGTSYNNLTSLTLDFYNTEPGVNYTMTLQSFVGNDHMSAKAICYIRTESGAPDAPQNATLVGDLAQDKFRIHVEDPDSPRGDIMSYKFILYSKYYIDDQQYTFNKNETQPVTSNNIYLISGLTPGTYYFVQVFTVNDAFTSETSYNITEIITTEGNPGMVANLNPTSSKNSANIMWMRPVMPNGNIIGYKVLINVSTAACREYIQENSTNAINSSCDTVNRTTINLNQNSMSQDIMNLKASTEYSVEVYAYTAVGVGEKSVINVETNSAPPFKPTNISGKALDSTSIKVNWQSPTGRTGPTSYEVTVYDVILGKDSSETCKSEGFNTTHCTVNNLKEYWLYTFQVTAVVKNGDTIVGRNSSGISSNVTTAEGVPGKVEQFTHSLENSGCRASLRWLTPVRENRNGLITLYQITISGSTMSYEDKDPQPYDPNTKSFEYPVVLKKGSIINVQIVAKNSKNHNGSPSYLKINTQDCFEPLSGGEVVGIVVCVLLLLAAIVLAGVIVYRKWDSISEFLTFRSPEEEVELLAPMKIIDRHSIISKYVICGGDDERFEPLRPAIEQNSGLLKAKLKRKRPIVLNYIKALLAKYHVDDNRLFIAEYEDLRTLQPRHPTNTANLDENKPKNRYTNILAYDHSRVILAPTEDEDSSDYINANYIPGYTYGKEFIASQGPLPGTTNDFWRMIWEQSVSVIVMLTECSEKNMDKCEHYWPYQANEPKCYDDLMVNITSKSNMGKYDITIMDLCLGDEKRVIKHFHFLEWPDFSARVETTTLIDFISTVRSHITPDIKGPTVTHCSAGVGRTGTFITVDYLMQYVRDNDLNSEVDIFDFVLQMREYRTTMVQTHTQYAFIHECLSDIVERKKKSLQRDSQLEMVNLAFEDDDLYENTKMEVMQEKTEL